MLSFFRRYQVLVSSFLSVLLSIYILAAAARGHLKTDPIGPLLMGLMRPLQIGAQTSIYKVRELEQRYVTLKGLAAENEALKRRITELETERNRLLEADATNRRLRDLLDFRQQLPPKAVTAAVVGNSASPWFHSIILDKGTADGVSKGMAVVSTLGVVGQVVEVTSRSAKVLLVTDPYSGVDVMVQRSRSRGIVSGSLENGPVMKYVKRSEDIRLGDRLISSGLDGVFPKGLLVGTVIKVEKKNFGLFQHVGVALAVDPDRMEEVLVVPASADHLRE